MKLGNGHDIIQSLHGMNFFKIPMTLNDHDNDQNLFQDNVSYLLLLLF